MLSTSGLLRGLQLDSMGWLELSLGVWAALLGVRLGKADSTAWLDGILFAVLEAWSLYRLYRTPALAPPASSYRLFLAVHLLATLLVLAAAGLWAGTKRPTRPLVERDAAAPTSTAPKPAAAAPSSLRTLLWPCRTTHTRLFPKVHSFGYSYLLVGVPIGADESQPARLVSVDTPHQQAWFHVAAEDHLERDSGLESKTLRQKLDDYLSAQGVEAGAYPHVYLVTAPRFLGYCFNPVSFWYLYSAERQLGAMILEVNNTFDERRMYLLLASDATGQFRTAWAKDFHVSPFNSRLGSYKLVAQDPRPFEGETVGIISNDITLVSSQGRPKLVARVFSTQGPVAEAATTVRDAARIAATWGWTGFLTFPRIVKEAGQLYFRHALEVFYRPEVVGATSIARQATHEERVLEDVFCGLLEAAVLRCPTALTVTYRRPAGFGRLRTLELRSQAARDGDDGGQGARAAAAVAAGNGTSDEVELEVVTPEFYRRVVHYRTMGAALAGECRSDDARDRTGRVTADDAGLARLLDAVARLPQQAIGCRWALLRRLRCAPAAGSYGSGSSSSSSSSCGGSSALDAVAATRASGRQYRRIVLEQFVAQRSGLPVAALATVGRWAALVAAGVQGPGRALGWVVGVQVVAGCWQLL